MRTFLLAGLILLLPFPTLAQPSQSLQEVAIGCKANVTVPSKWLGPCENGLADGHGVLEEETTRCTMHLKMVNGKSISFVMEKVCPASGNPHDYLHTIHTPQSRDTTTIKAHQVPMWAGYSVTGVHTEALRASGRAHLASSAVTRCDELAASETDPNRVTRPPKVRPAAAEIVRACKAALSKEPENLRLLTQLAVGLRTIDADQAALKLKEAARAGYAEAGYQLAREAFERLERSPDLNPELRHALLYGAIIDVTQAVEQGHPGAILLDVKLFNKSARFRYESLRNEWELPGWAKVKKRRLSLQSVAAQTFDPESAKLAAELLKKGWTINPFPVTYVGDGPREYVSDVSRYPFSAIGRLFSYPGACSAAVVGDRRTIVSNLHCIRDGWPEGKPLLFDLQGRTPFSTVKEATSAGEKQSIPAGLYRARLWKKGRITPRTEKYFDFHIEQDWAIFHLDRPVPEQVQPLGLINQTAYEGFEKGEFQSKMFHVAGFAFDADKMNRMIYVTACGIPADIRVTSARAYNSAVECPSYKGTSGAPILIQVGSEFQLFGLHFAGKVTDSGSVSFIHVSWDLIEAIKQKTTASR